ncbi:MAG: nicotinate-nucleotide pyrophosphorylase (carboxylating) [Candidatus Methanocomedens sp.]|nr:MAG: nicotinate-nucleotide pyrophosphorylase (carboxylating) [ANME-2 cluster archaeon]
MLITELEQFIQEDVGDDDTSCSIVPDAWVHARIITKEAGVLAGLEECRQVIDYFGLEFEPGFDDGDAINPGDVVADIWGMAPDVLRAERLSLNFLCRMSGIATVTARCAADAGGVRVACTRKTTPGFRKFEKKAVRLGGGDTHRFNLSDAVMIKDNHIAIMGIENAIHAARAEASFTKKIEVEVSGADEMLTAARAGVDIIMFDNMLPDEISQCIQTLEDAKLRKGIILETSGGINPDNISEYVGTGVNVVSMGSLIHSSRWLDMGLDIL